jgi:hypothetical protein
MMQTASRRCNSWIKGYRLSHTISPAKPVHGAIGASRPFDQGDFILLSEPASTINSAGVKYVLVNEHFYGAIPTLQKRYPNVRFIRADEATEELPEILQEK